MKVLVTGGCGFIGSCLVKKLLDQNNIVINVDKLTYAGSLENLDTYLHNKNHIFVHKDINDSLLETVFNAHKPDAVVHMAADSHVDRSIENASPFVQTNIVGTWKILEHTKKYNVKKILVVSTDEVYGQLKLNDLPFLETTNLDPSSPYSSSKASGDLLALSYYKTYGLPIVVSRCSNNYGSYQFPEKLLPVLIQKALNNEQLPIYGDGKQVRDWIHVSDHCDALLTILEKGVAGNVYNIGGNNEVENIKIAKKILSIMNKSESLISFVKDRLGHDFRYAINAQKIKTQLSWYPKISFNKGLEDTVSWYTNNQNWVKNSLKRLK